MMTTPPQPMENSRDIQQALIFIPDISGFTKFVSDTEISHNQNIIAALLEVILESNQMEMEVSEIEGDAVLFYKLGKAPGVCDVARQAERMFLSFHQKLRVMDKKKACGCSVCVSMCEMSLKFIVHAGTVKILNVRGFTKLLGSDVIVAHRLLKNSVRGKEYILMSESYLRSQEPVSPEGELEWAEPLCDGSTEYEHLGTIRYKYLSLTPLRSMVPPV